MKEKSKKIFVWIILAALVVATAVLGYNLYKKNQETTLVSENAYNRALYEVVGYMENVENYLAKSTISTGSKHGAETLTSLWREANLAQTYLSMLPIESQELENTEKFLNQVSDYSYSLSRKNINGENLSEDDLKNLEDLHKYSVELSNVVNQISFDLENGSISWKDLQGGEDVEFAQQVSSDFNISTTLEENFHEYSGLIYDGAYSEHITSKKKKGLTGEKISEDDGENIVREFVGNDNIKELNRLGKSDNASTPVFTYNVITKDEQNISMTISEKGGHIVYMNSDREVAVENLTQEEANKKGLEFLNKKGFNDMIVTYYLKNEGIVTINYAYSQNGTVMYPDLIKLKIALDDGEILGVETKGYLNNHTKRDLSKVKVSKEQAKKKLNKNLNIQSEKMAVIPTEWETEVLCYEFKGKILDTEYLVYINAETGEEEDILIITNTPNGTLTM